jgi:hypothetical protein
MGIKDDMTDGVVYKTVNRYSTDRHIYLMPDVPHLIKTTRNCWYASRAGGTRCMWVSVLLDPCRGSMHLCIQVLCTVQYVQNVGVPLF